MFTSLHELFGVVKPVIGMIHLPPLPSSPAYFGADIGYVVEQALRDAEALKAGGVDGVQVENIADKPFMKPAEIDPVVVSVVASVAKEVRKSVGLPTGVFVLANAVEESIRAAAACGAEWVRANLYNLAYVADEGFVEACAAKVERRRRLYNLGVRIFADVMVKHGSHFIVSDLPLEYQVNRLEALGADAVIVSGMRTGDETPLERLVEVKNVATKPVLVGSGLNPVNAEKLLMVADGAIVGTYFKREGKLFNPVDAERVKKVMAVVRNLRLQL